ncbi:MAG: AIR synthase-related protein, partial [Pseudomonadota bacterium]|nr:AIR synthase-related protein [Pseudomonadota bacterium]
MLILDGGSAVSRFRISKLYDQVRESLPSLEGLTARYLHVALTNKQLLCKKREILDRLLDYGVSADTTTTGLEIMVFPRTGTISPWSTKATDIVHHCGLSEIVRLERGVSWIIRGELELPAIEQHLIPLLYDKMTESIISSREKLQVLFSPPEPGKLTKIEVLGGGQDALIEANERMGFALSDDEIDYLVEQYRSLGRDPTDAELMMFAQVNSEHCRHKIFNADWVIGGEPMPDSLFGMIRTTHERHKQGTLVAYNDNAAVIEGQAGCWFLPDPMSGVFKRTAEPLHILCKVETHNHPTGISPYPGAATGSGGEIRDEGATGRGGKPKAGITGFSVSDLRLPGASMPWELPEIRNPRQADALQIMLDGPIGGASFNNEFGRPNIGGYFRTLEVACASGIREVRRGYHKPIMLAGGLGNIRSDHVYKNTMSAGAKLVVLGGPAMLIGLGGGAASSVDSGQSTASLDFASVQRGNAEMQRRCQEVIDACIARGQNNPIITIHDVGAGGLSNALPELIHDSNLGGEFSLSKIPNDEPG